MASSSSADDKTPLPLLRSDDNPHTNYPEFKDRLCSRAHGMHSVHDTTGAFDKVAPASDWGSEPANVIPAVAAAPPSGSDPGSALVPASVRARPNPALSTRSDSDSARVASNKNLLDAKHTSWVQACVDLKALIVTAIGTERCESIASAHPNW
jgi:hypothetical protein